MVKILASRHDRGGWPRSCRWSFPIGVGFRKIGITFGVEARGLIILAGVAVILAVSCFSAIGALLLRLGLGSISRRTTLNSIVGAEVPFLEGAFDRVEDQSVQSVSINVLLDGENQGFWNGVAQGQNLS